MNAITHDQATLADPAATPVKRRLPFSRRTLLVVSAALLVAAAGSAWLAAPKSTVATEAAYVETDTAVVAPRVRGLVAQVLVADNQAVKKGDPLVAIDPEEFDARLASAEADQANAEAAALAARAALGQLSAEESLAAANIRAAQTHIRAAEAQADVARADQVRYDALAASGWAAGREVDRVRAVAVTAQSDAERRRAELDVSRNQAGVTAAKRATLQAGLAQAEAAVARARAAVDLARQDQAHAVIRAPIDGVVGDRKVEPGVYVQPGTRLLTIAPMTTLYVTANFKETQTGRMTAGQKVSIKIDALPGQTLTGTVDSFAPGTGSQFSLLPFEPGTGNFTKIVQRVPVRIRLDPGQPALAKLRPGLSATVKVSLQE